MLKPGAVKSYVGLTALTLLLIVAEIIIGRYQPSIPGISDAVFLTLAFAFAALISLLIFFNGYISDGERSVLMTLIALGVKMLLSFIIALLFFLVLKNDSTGSVILFFILYLAFTLYVVLTFTGVLKKKSD